jgi:UDP-N-acetylglucosamine 2-epimerase
MNRVTSILSNNYDLFCLADALDKIEESFNHTVINTHDHYSSLNNLKEEVVDTNPEVIIFWGNSAANDASILLKKEGYTIVHVGAGIRSGSRTSPSEIDRTVCDLCSDYHFVYHDHYGKNLLKENFKKETIFVTGNPTYQTNKEARDKVTKTKTPTWFKKRIILNITDPQNINNEQRLSNLIAYAFHCEQEFNTGITFLNSPEALKQCEQANIDLPFPEDARRTLSINETIDYLNLAQLVAQSIFVISDSEMLAYQAYASEVPVIIPIDYLYESTSFNKSCYTYVDVNELFNPSWKKSLNWVEKTELNLDWIKNQDAPENIVDSLKIVIEEKQ